MPCKQVTNGSNRMNDARGFTLVEIAISIAVSLIMIFAIGMAIESASRSSGGIERKVTAQQDVRGALEIMALEIKMASYNPTLADNALIWRNTDCTGPPAANPAYKGIQEATANSITVEMDISDGLGGDGQGTLTDANEIIRYEFVQTGNDRYITRETINCGSVPPSGGAQPFLGDTIASGRPRTVRVINAGGDVNVPVFRYFDGQGLELLGVGRNCMPGCSADIRMIEITLAVETEEIDPSTDQTRRMIYKTRETLRNN